MGILLGAVVFGLVQITQAVTLSGTASVGDSSVPAGALIMTGAQNTRPAGTYSKSVTEIVRMLDAKLDAPVIVAYIKNSSMVSQPEASEMIALKEHGATTEVQLALVNRGGELRQQYVEAMQAMQKQAAAARVATQAPVASEPVTPVYNNPQLTAYPDYPVYSYDYTPYYYSSYPYYRSGYSYSYWPTFNWGLGFNWCWNNNRWCWSGDRNFGRVNNSYCWNGNRWNGSHWNSGFNTRSTPQVSHAAFAPVRSAPAVVRSGSARSFSGGMHVAAGGGSVRAGHGR